MERKTGEIKETKVINFREWKLSRKQSIKRTGIMAASAATMMLLLSSQCHTKERSSAQSSASATTPTNQTGENHKSSDNTHSNHRR